MFPIARSPRRLVSPLSWLAPLLLAGLILSPGAPAGAQESSSRIVYSTFLGGSGDEHAFDIAVDGQGHAWIVGMTDSLDFPGAGTPPVPGRYSLGFLVHLGARGERIASSLVDGGRAAGLRAVALDPAGTPWEVGTVYDDDLSSILLGRHTSFSTFNRFAAYELGIDLGFDASGNLYLLGETEHGFDLFVQKRSPTGEEIQITELRPDHADALAVGGDGTTYVLGSGDLIRLDPEGHELYLPAELGAQDIAADLTGNLHLTGVKNEDLHYAVTTPEGAVISSFSIGGSGLDVGRWIALGPAGDVALLGWTDSPDFPLVQPLDSDCARSVSRPGFCETTPILLRLVGGRVVLSTYLEVDYRYGNPSAVALGPGGDLYVAGHTSDPDFPTLNATQPVPGGRTDAFVIRIAGNRPPDCGSAFAAPAEVWPPNGRFVPVAIRGVTDPEGELIALSVTSIRQDEPLTRPGAADATGVGSPAARVRADRAGSGDGRVYAIRFEARDGQGAVCAGSVTVCVPHDRGKRRHCVDGGPVFDATAGAR
jgi:hypothetical protein